MSRGVHKMRKGLLPIVIIGSVAGNVSSVDGTTHSVGNIDVGPGGSKNVIMGITWNDGAVVALSSMTVGGVGLTIVAQVNNAGGSKTGSAICVGDISSINGSQAISCTFAAAVDSCGASGVSITGLQSLTETMVDTDFQDGGASPVITNLAAEINGIAFAVCANNADTVTASWSSLTEKADIATGSGGGNHRHTSAWDLGERSAANETITWTDSDKRTAVGAGFT